MSDMGNMGAMEHRIKIAAKMKAFRLDRLWTLKQMASACDLAVGAIWLIENGRVTPHERTVAKIRKAFPGIFDACDGTQSTGSDQAAQ